MRKQNLLKLAFAFMAVFLFVGVQAQVQDDNYVTNTDIVYQTAGKTFRLYVEPDAVYSPNFVAPAWTLGTNALWTWTYTGLTGAPATATPENQNWVEFTNPTVGSYTVSVVESNAIASCTGSAVTKDVEVIAAPTAQITTPDPAQFCDDQAALPVEVQFTENVPSAWASYAFAIRETVENININDEAIGAPLVNNDAFVDYATTGKLNGLGGTQPNYTWSFNTSALEVLNNLRTRYTYTLIGASDAGSDGLISAISQKSDYVGGTVLTHDFGAETTFVVIVNPAPTTGPIYHIPNDYAF